MGIIMPHPVLLGNTYYLRVHIPSDVVDKVAGTMLSIPINGKLQLVKANKIVKASLRTKDAKVARQRFLPALAALDDYWEVVRVGPQPLTHKTSLAMAGAIREVWIEAFDADPVTPALWKHVRDMNKAAVAPADISAAW